MAEEVGFLPSAVLRFEEPRMLKAESLESEAMLIDITVGVFAGLVGVGEKVCSALNVNVFLSPTSH